MRIPVSCFSRPSAVPGRRGLICLAPLLLLLLSLACLGRPEGVDARIYIDINAPSLRKFKIAAPDFSNQTPQGACADLSAKLPGVVSRDLDLSGFFSPMDKAAFLETNPDALTLESIRFRDWSVVGAELLLKGSYTCIGRNLEVEVRLFDVFGARQILGKRFLGTLPESRPLMHRVSGEIFRALTGQEGIFLTKIAFVGNATGHKEIYVSDFDGENVRQLTADKSIAQMPRWSPDGKKMLFNSYRDGGTMMYLRDTETGSVRRISGRTGLNIGAAWAPDGSRFALTLSPEGDPDIFLMDLNGKVLKRLTNQLGIDVSPSFSPDGNRIAFVSDRSGNPQIYVMDLQKGTQERITFDGNYNTSPSWSAQNRIAFTSMRNGLFDIGTLDPGGGPVKWLTASQGKNEDPCWSPDGRYLIFSSNRAGAYQVHLMDANGNNQRRLTALDKDQISPSWAR